MYYVKISLGRFAFAFSICFLYSPTACLNNDVPRPGAFCGEGDSLLFSSVNVPHFCKIGVAEFVIKPLVWDGLCYGSIKGVRTGLLSFELLRVFSLISGKLF